MQRLTILLFSLIYIVCPAAADNRNTAEMLGPDTWAGRMQRQIDSLIRMPMFETSQLGLYVKDITDGRELVCVNQRYLMRPASCEKIATAVAALHTLGNGYLLRTELMLTGEVRDNILYGDLCVRGGMDPMLSRAEVMQMAGACRQVGIDSIAGILYVDLSFKDGLEKGWGWCWDDNTVPMLPLMVDKKNTFVTDFLNGLAQAGVRGMTIDRVLYDKCPAGSRTFCEVTHTIDQVLQPMMKRSDNFYAESLFYQLAALGHPATPGTRNMAVAQVDVLIRHIGLNPADYQIADGSGLSLYNYQSPELIVRLLEYAWKTPSIRQSLYTALPIAGVDGTLEKRMKRTKAQGNVHAKTGTVEGISSLSGYATSPEGHILAFSIINQGILKTETGRQFQDKVCQALTN